MSGSSLTDEVWTPLKDEPVGSDMDSGTSRAAGSAGSNTGQVRSQAAIIVEHHVAILCIAVPPLPPLQ